MSQLKVYGTPMSRAARTLWMCRELGIPFEHVNVHFADGSAKTPEYLAINPNGRIPAIQDGDFTLYESMAINLYLARKHPGPLTPATLEDEARAWQWSFWVMTEVEKPLVTVLLQRLQLPPGSAEEKYFRQRVPMDAKKESEALAELPKPFGVLETELGETQWLGGDRFTVTDLNVASVMAWAPLANIDLSARRPASSSGWAVARPAPRSAIRPTKRRDDAKKPARGRSKTESRQKLREGYARAASPISGCAKRCSRSPVSWKELSYGTPAFRVGKGFLCRFHQDGESLVVPFDLDDREILIRADPESFYITDHYRAYPYVLARLPTVDRGALRDLLEEAWRRQAPKRLRGEIEREGRKSKRRRSGLGARRPRLVVAAPVAQRREHRVEGAAELGERVLDARRHFREHLAHEQTVGLELAELLGQHLGRDLGDGTLELGETSRSFE